MEQDNLICPSVDRWNDVAAREVPVSELDQATREYLESRTEYEARKKDSSEANAVMKEKMRKLLTLMEQAGKRNWETEEGKAIMVDKLQYATPKTADDKKALARYIREVHGDDAFWTLFSVNSMTLQGFAKQEIEANPELEIPGLEAPTHSTNIQFRRKR